MMKVFFSLLPFFCLMQSQAVSKALEVGCLLHVQANMEGGKKLLLTDDSLWEVDPNDLFISSLWLSPFHLEISWEGSDPYPYLLINTQSQKKVRARRIGQAHPSFNSLS